MARRGGSQGEGRVPASHHQPRGSRAFPRGGREAGFNTNHHCPWGSPWLKWGHLPQRMSLGRAVPSLGALLTPWALQVGPGLVQTPRTGNFPQSTARAPFPALLNLSCCCFPMAQAALKAHSHQFRTFSCDLCT